MARHRSAGGPQGGRLERPPRGRRTRDRLDDRARLAARPEPPRRRPDLRQRRRPQRRAAGLRPLHRLLHDQADRPAVRSAAQGASHLAMSRRVRPWLIVLTPLVLLVVLGVAFGSEGQNTAYKPQEEFRLTTWVNLPGPFDINKAVLYLLLAAVATTLTMLYIARRMQDKPNRVQTAVEVAFSLMRDNIAGGNMDARMARRWFTFVATLFLFIWWSNMIGYIPLPTNSQEKFDLFGAQIPSFALYAATANISVPLILTLVVWFSYHFEGVRAKGLIGYLKSWVPAGVEGAAAVPIFFIEVISHFVRI